MSDEKKISARANERALKVLYESIWADFCAGKLTSEGWRKACSRNPGLKEFARQTRDAEARLKRRGSFQAMGRNGQF